MKIVTILSFVLLLSFGIFMIVFGESDDSPGAQLIGVLASLGAIVGIVRTIKKFK